MLSLQVAGSILYIQNHDIYNKPPPHFPMKHINNKCLFIMQFIKSLRMCRNNCLLTNLCLHL